MRPGRDGRARVVTARARPVAEGGAPEGWGSSGDGAACDVGVQPVRHTRDRVGGATAYRRGPVAARRVFRPGNGADAVCGDGLGVDVVVERVHGGSLVWCGDGSRPRRGAEAVVTGAGRRSRAAVVPACDRAVELGREQDPARKGAAGEAEQAVAPVDGCVAVAVEARHLVLLTSSRVSRSIGPGEAIKHRGRTASAASHTPDSNPRRAQAAAAARSSPITFSRRDRAVKANWLISSDP
jgi:hypothetical protein